MHYCQSGPAPHMTKKDQAHIGPISLGMGGSPSLNSPELMFLGSSRQREESWDNWRCDEAKLVAL